MTLTSGGFIAMLVQGAENTLYYVVAIPTKSGNFSCLSIFLGGVLLSERTEAWRNTCFQHPSPSNTLEKVEDGYQSHYGDLTMSNPTDRIGRQEEPCTVKVHSIPFDVCLDSHFFSTNKDIAPDRILPHVACLLAGVRDIIQAESDADLLNDGRGITSTHYTLLAILTAAEALINSIQIYKGEPK